MKKLSLRSYIEIGLVFVVLCLFAVIVFERHQSNKTQQDLRNQLSAAQGSVEILEGVQYRLSEEGRITRRNLEEILGENTNLRAAIKILDGRIFAVSQVNASLREDLEFASTRENSSATTTVIEYRCPVDPSSDEPIETSLPNLRVDFDLETNGFRAVGHTETNPSYAEVVVSQLDAFIIDLALNQAADGSWAAIASEQSERLELEIGALRVNPRVVRERWYERLGMGVAVNAGLDAFAVGPAFHLETSTFDYGLNATYDITRNSIVGGFSATYRPFRRR